MLIMLMLIKIQQNTDKIIIHLEILASDKSRPNCPVIVNHLVIEGFHNNAEKDVSIVFIFLSSDCSIYKGEIQILDTNLQRHRKHRYNI